MKVVWALVVVGGVSAVAGYGFVALSVALFGLEAVRANALGAWALGLPLAFLGLVMVWQGPSSALHLAIQESTADEERRHFVSPRSCALSLWSYLMAAFGATVGVGVHWFG